MTITPSQFRTNFPEFSDTTKYPVVQVQFWLDLAYSLMSKSATQGDCIRSPVLRWGAQLDYGVQLFTAHNLALEAQAQKTAALGGVPGMGVGPLASKSVGPLAASYDTGLGAIKDGGNFNLTIYGTRFLFMVDMVGAGGMVL
jgi:hypothetical protein